MRLLSRLPLRVWILILLGAAGFLVWAGSQRLQRVEYVTNTDRGEVVFDPASPTGYAGGKRWLIVPEHYNRSYQWIAETQQMVARQEWRVRHADHENAPLGRPVYSASPYRWWLVALAWCDHTLTGRPLVLAVERAALWSDPLLHLVLLVGTTVFVARRFGTLPAVLIALGLAVLFPFAGSFLPGVPDDRGLTRILALWSVLPLLAAVGGGAPAPASRGVTAAAGRAAAVAPRTPHRWFLGVGIIGGLGLWIDALDQAAVLAGIGLGAVLAAWIGARTANRGNLETWQPAPWRTWALAGATTCLAAYLVEYAPAHLDFRLQVNHPLYGLAWLGLGELLTLIEHRFKWGQPAWKTRQSTGLLLAVAALAALPLAMWMKGMTDVTADLSASRLAILPNAPIARNFAVWLVRDGLTGAVIATCLPLVFLGPAVYLLALREAALGQRTAVALALGPVLVALALACTQLVWWSMAGGLLLTLVVAASAGPQRTSGSSGQRWLWPALTAVAFLPGLIQLLPPRTGGDDFEFTRFEVEGLIERAIAHWLADRAGPNGALVLLPPFRTTSWCFHGGLRGLGTDNWENREGVAATVRIISATSAETAEALINERGITHIVLPSWDSDLEQFARWTLENPADAFVMALQHWAIPVWLRPLPYQLPVVPGFEGQSVVILAVTGETNRTAALSRLAEYFIETRRTEQMQSSRQALQRFPADLNALVALAQVEKAGGDAEGYARTVSALLASLAGGGDRALAWDRRVSLAIVLAEGERLDLAREQVVRCLKGLDEARIRSLTTASLYRLQMLTKTFGLQISNPSHRELARKLLPAELQQRL